MGLLSGEAENKFCEETYRVLALSELLVQVMEQSVDAVADGNIEEIFVASNEIKKVNEALLALSKDLGESPIADATGAIHASGMMFIQGLDSYPEEKMSKNLMMAGTIMHQASVFSLSAGMELMCGDEELGELKMKEASIRTEQVSKDVVELISNIS